MAVVVLMIGLHLSFDSHFCGGTLADVKFSMTGEKASCGMETEPNSFSPSGISLTPVCCKDDLTTLTTDSNYSPSFSNSPDFYKKVLNVYAIPLSEVVAYSNIFKISPHVLSLQDVFRAYAVFLAAICVFRI